MTDKMFGLGVVCLEQVDGGSLQDELASSAACVTTKPALKKNKSNNINRQPVSLQRVEHVNSTKAAHEQVFHMHTKMKRHLK